MRNYEIKLVDSSRKLADMLTDDIGNCKERMAEMMSITLKDEYPLSMRAARIVSLVTEKFPTIIFPYISEIITRLKSFKTEGVRRGFIKILSETEYQFNEEETGYLADLAFSTLSDSGEAISVRYYSIEIILRIIKIYPELANELKEVLTGMDEEQSAGMISKKKQALKYISRLTS